MSTLQTIKEINLAVGDIDSSIKSLESLKTAIGVEAYKAMHEFDSGQDFGQMINVSNSCVDEAITELKKTRESLTAISYALR